MSTSVYVAAVFTATFGAGMLYLGLTQGRNVSLTNGGATAQSESRASDPAAALAAMDAAMDAYRSDAPGGPEACAVGDLAAGAKTLAAASLASDPKRRQTRDETTLRISGAPRVVILTAAADGAATYWRIQAAPGAVRAVVLDDPTSKVAHIHPTAPLIVYDERNPACPPLTGPSSGGLETRETGRPSDEAGRDAALSGAALVRRASAFRAAQEQDQRRILARAHVLAEALDLAPPSEAAAAPRGANHYAQ